MNSSPSRKHWEDPIDDGRRFRQAVEALARAIGCVATTKVRRSRLIRRVTLAAVVAVLACAGLAAGALAALPGFNLPPTSAGGTTSISATTTTPSVTTTPTATTPTATTAETATEQTVDVLFVVRGTAIAFTAAKGTTNGSISLRFARSNHATATLKSAAMTLTFLVGARTHVVLHDHKPIARSDEVAVKFDAPKNASLAALESTIASQVIDESGKR